MHLFYSAGKKKSTFWPIKRAELRRIVGEEVNSMEKVNHAIGCEVFDCMYNCNGKNCTLEHIVVGNTCDCEAEKCTCCENFKRK